MSDKRKKVVLSIHKKLELIKQVEYGVSKKQISLQYGIGESTVRDIYKQKDKLVQFVSTSDDYSSMKRRKTMKRSTYEELDEVLLEWVSQLRSEGTHISGTIVAAKAKEFFQMLGLEGTFDASAGWLARFKQRHGITDIGLHGEILSGDANAVENVKADLKEDYEETKEQITHEAALSHIDGLIQYLEEQNHPTLCDKIVLKKLQSQVKKKCSTTKSQNPTTDSLSE